MRRRPGAIYLAIRAYQRARSAMAGMRDLPEWNGVRMLAYHRIADQRDTLSVSPARFRAQLAIALASGAIPLRLSDALERLADPVAGRFFCVTFDDGYRDNVEAGEPILAELGIPATIFLPTRFVDGKLQATWFDPAPPILTWPEVRAAQERGVFEFEAHSRTHPLLTSLDDARVWDEIAGSKLDIEREIGSTVTSFCYPAGFYRAREVELVASAGYLGAVTTEPGVNAGGGGRHELRRTLVYGEDADREFALKMAGAFDRAPWPRALYYRMVAARGRARPDIIERLPRRR